MRRALRAICVAEVILASHLSAVGSWWAGCAMRRLGKISARFPGVKP